MDKFTCRFCGDVFTNEDLREFREMGEAYFRGEALFVCPDCYDAFSRLPLEDQAKEAMTIEEVKKI